MNIQKIEIAGRAIDAGVPLPIPGEDPPKGSRVKDLMRELGAALDDYMETRDSMETGDVMTHVDDTGAAYWMRIITDEGVVFVKAVPRDESMFLEVGDARSAPASLRPH